MNKIKQLFRSVYNYFKVEEMPALKAENTEPFDYPLFMATMADKAGDCFVS